MAFCDSDDLWVPEAFVHYSLVANPHFPLAMALMLIIFGQVLDAPSGPKAMNFHP